MGGRVVILNGTPRSGKSSLALAVQERFEGVWVGLGVDLSMMGTPERFRPGMGLRPGGERPDLEPVVRALYSALYESVAAHSRLGLNVVVDVGHHDDYTRPLGTLMDAAGRLEGAPAWLVGVRCPAEVVLARRRATGMAADEAMVERWDRVVHDPGVYDLEIDTSVASPGEGAEAIRQLLEAEKPVAFHELRRSIYRSRP